MNNVNAESEDSHPDGAVNHRMGEEAHEGEGEDETSGESVPVAQEEEEQQEEEPAGVGSLPPIMGQDDPRRMKLTLEEMELAWSIKGTIEASSDIDHIDVSDYTYAQLALVCADAPNPEEEATQRLLDLQAFKEEYDIQDTLSHGCRALEDWFQILPTYIIHFGFKDDEGTYVQVMDHQGFTPHAKAFKSDANFRKYMVGNYYMLHAMGCDLQTVRTGPIVIVDCAGIGWSMKDDYKILKEFLSQIFSVYPMRLKALRHYNTGTIANLLMGMASRVLPKKTREMFLQTGLTTEGRLKDMFLVPTAQEATKRTVQHYQDSLKRKYDNERNFVLG